MARPPNPPILQQVQDERMGGRFRMGGFLGRLSPSDHPSTMFRMSGLGRASIPFPLILNLLKEGRKRDGWRRRCPYFSHTTGLVRAPMPSIAMVTTSPSLRFSGAPSVPIQRTSPG